MASVVANDSIPVKLPRKSQPSVNRVLSREKEGCTPSRPHKHPHRAFLLRKLSVWVRQTSRDFAWGLVMKCGKPSFGRIIPAFRASKFHASCRRSRVHCLGNVVATPRVQTIARPPRPLAPQRCCWSGGDPDGAEGMAEQMNPVPDGVFDRSHVLKLALHGVCQNLAALPVHTGSTAYTVKRVLSAGRTDSGANVSACAMYQRKRCSCVPERR